nr:MAG TPA: hypothetical protein [Caudoviricetes sp.]
MIPYMDICLLYTYCTMLAPKFARIFVRSAYCVYSKHIL